jgi:heme exporter protein D
MSCADFFAMKGYGLYVWGSYGVAALVFVVEIILVGHRRKIALRQLRLMRDSHSDAK